MRIAHALAVAAIMVVSALSSACSEPLPPVARPSAGPPEPVEEVHVRQLVSFEGDENEYVDVQRPESLHLQEFTSAEALEWRAWGGDAAEATGKVKGMWCAGLDGCDEGYDATVVLCDVADGRYQRFAVFGDFTDLVAEGEAHVFASPLYFSDIEYSDDEWYGCEDPDSGDRP